MANIASQIKRNRQNEKRRLRNREYRGAARTAIKDALGAMSSEPDSSASVLAAISALDRAAQKGAIHHRNAARRKGRLLKRLAALRGSAQLTARPATEVKEKASSEAAARRAERTEPAAKPKSEAKKAPARAVEKKPVQKKTASKKAAKK